MPLQGSPLSSVQGQAGTPHPSQEHDGGGEQGAAGGEKQPRKKARIKWITFATGTGFKAARSLLEDLARRECDGLRLGPRGDTTSTHQEIQYTFSCSYRKKPWCFQWRCKVCITRKTISGATYASVSVEDGDRDAEHMDDAFEILVPADGTLAHSDHTVSNERGTHPLFVASARTCPEMLGWDRTAISRWIMQNHIADPQDTLSFRIKKSNELCVRSQMQSALPLGTQPGTLGALIAATHQLSFANVLQKEGKAFNWNTAYIVPGSLVPESALSLAPGSTSFLCLMFTSFRLSLEYYRVLRAFGTAKGVTLSLDHTFKVSSCLVRSSCVVSPASVVQLHLLVTIYYFPSSFR